MTSSVNWYCADARPVVLSNAVGDRAEAVLDARQRIRCKLAVHVQRRLARRRHGLAVVVLIVLTRTDRQRELVGQRQRHFAEQREALVAGLG